MPAPARGRLPRPASTTVWRTESPEQDREWVRLSQQGDPSGFEMLVRKYQQPIFRLVYHSLGPRADVDDVAQKVFAKVYFSLHKFDNTRPFFPWLYRIACNQCHDELRQMRRNRVLTFTELRIEETERIERLISQPEAPAPSGEEPKEIHSVLLKMMDKLHKQQRTALVLRDMEDVPYEKIAEIMGCTEQAARLKVFRARARLRDLVLKAMRRRARAGK
jgi:RNA polymerase sigma-70 factor (ECF subfamily)